ncbi:sensor histidine kinase [Terriglobus albidus]|uniref:sensor histidine kinase n=1 Tax=Terriglobus albidus TaxID=1592106 RepID=UPI0021DF7938|nr:ATP-binding protein [Terriglobus albidus]
MVVLWDIAPDLPLVWADRATLMQVLLNLTTNSLRALAQVVDKVLTISIRHGDGCVLLEFLDNGCGVAHPERLFHPFQEGAQVTGLGLYLSRAFMRSFGGDLRYEPVSRGTAFVMEIPTAQQMERTR